MDSEDAGYQQIPHATTSTSTSPLIFDSAVLLALRVVYFLLSRRFLLSTINPTLRDLSKSETLLPATLAPDRTTNSRSPSLSLAAQEYELDTGLDTEDDGLLSANSPAPSYPPTPTRSNAPLPGSGSGSSRAPYRSSSPSPAHTTLPYIPDERGSVEMGTLGQKLKDVGKKQVIQLTHGRPGVGTKRVKKATRGLNRVSRALFSACFAEGCNLLTLVIFHAIGILHSRSRHVNFSISLHVLLGMILLVVPLVQCLLLTYRSRESSSSSTSASTRASSLSLTTRILIALIPFTLYVFLFTRIPPYVTAVASIAPSPVVDDSTGIEVDIPTPTPLPGSVSWTEGPEGWEGEGWLASSLGRVVVLGVVVLGALSGFGAVRTALNFYEQIRGGSGSLSDTDIIQAERSLYRVRQDIVAKREEMGRISSHQEPSGSGSGGWMGKVFGSKADQEVASLQAEMAGLRAMESQVARSLSAMKIKKRRQEFGGTMTGRVYHVIGYIFAIYCTARVLMALPSVFFAPKAPDQDTSQPHQKGNTNGDWISFLLALSISHLPTGTLDIDVGVWSRGISLLLTGVLILSSLTQVLRSLTRVLRLTSKTVGAGFLLLSLGQLFSTYVISLLVQLRTSLPPTSSEVGYPDQDPNNSTESYPGPNTVTQDDSLLASLPDFRIFGRVFDIVFLMAAFGTALYRYIAHKVNAADDSGEIYQYQ